MKINKTFLIVSLSLLAIGVKAQTYSLGINAITTAVPFATLSPDARSGSMGDIGASTSPDANSMHWNPAKFAFIEKKAGVALSYTPWMSNLVSDIHLFNIAGYYKIDEKQAVAATISYFSLGEIDLRDDYGNPQGTGRPNEFLIDGTYSRKFSEKISGAVAARFIYSDLNSGIGQVGVKPGTSVAADIAIYYVEPFTIKDLDAQFALGVNISNVGSKMSYDPAKSEKEFIPTNLRIGPSLKLDIDDFNNIYLGFEINKLLIPSRPISDPNTKEVIYGKDPNVSLFKGMVQSFYDAPGYAITSNGDTTRIGVFREELQEVSLAVGLEYWYNKLLALRAGYFYEHPRKGDRQFITLGAGLRYNVFGIDLSYLISLSKDGRHPLQNSLRFTLSFDFGY